MTRVAVLLAWLGMLALVGPAGAGLSVGVNDDAGKDPALTSWFFPTIDRKSVV